MDCIRRSGVTSGQEVQYTKAAQSSQHQDQKQPGSGAMFWQRRTLSNRVDCDTVQHDCGMKKESAEDTISDICRKEVFSLCHFAELVANFERF